jgi:hypothetical protein
LLCHRYGFFRCTTYALLYSINKILVVNLHMRSRNIPVTSNCVLNVSKARSILLSLIVPKSPILIASVNAVTNAVVGFSSNSNTSSSEPSVTSTLSRPPLEYIGLITNKQNGQQLAVIKHNNQIYKVRLGDKIANCTIFNIQKDSVQVSLKGAINTVKR